MEQEVLLKQEKLLEEVQATAQIKKHTSMNLEPQDLEPAEALELELKNALEPEEDWEQEEAEALELKNVPALAEVQDLEPPDALEPAGATEQEKV